MAQRKQTLYVSSTFPDLKAHRAALKVSLEKAGYDVESMERYAAFPEPPLDKCVADVADCDGFVLLLAHKYGVVTNGEYEAALQHGKPVFAFCVDQDHSWPPAFVDSGKRGKLLHTLRARIEKAHGYATFTEPDNLAKQVLEALAKYRWPDTADAKTAAAIPAAPAYRWPPTCDFSAYIAEKGACFEGRDWLFDAIAAWQAAPEPHALLIRADFGVGKSALVAELIRRNRGGAIVASHFCQHDTPEETLQPGVFVRSIAAQLAAALPDYRALVEVDPALKDRLDHALTDPGSALEFGILSPLSRLQAPAGSRVVVIDALDEALEFKDSTRGSITTTIVSLLASKARRFPRWLRVLATSRPNPLVVTPLQHAFTTHEIDAESAGNHEDLRRYILGRCQGERLAAVLQAKQTSPEALTDLLLERSEGKFLYAVRALDDVARRRLSIGDLAALPPGMDSFYFDAFERRYARAGRDYAGARRVLGVLAAAREPVPPALAAEVLQIGEAEVKAVHRELPDFLRKRAGKLAFDHFSMAEWLTREDADGLPRAGDYAVDANASQAAWRRWALRQVEDGRAHRSDYLLRNLPAHLADDAERRRVWGTLLLEHFEWLQARLDLADVEALLADVTVLEGMPGQMLLLALLRNSAHVLGWSADHLPAQVLGRLGRKGDHELAPLVASTIAWVANADNAARSRRLLPTTCSLRLSTAQLAMFFGGREPLAVLPDGRIASGSYDNSVHLWDPARPAEPIVFKGHADWVRALAVLPDGRIASGSEDNTVRLWDPARPAEPVVFAGHSKPITALAALLDGRVASGSEDNTVRLWGPGAPG